LAIRKSRRAGKPEFPQRRCVGNRPHDQEPITPWWYGPSEYSSCTHAYFCEFCRRRRGRVGGLDSNAASSGCGHDWLGDRKPGLYCISDSEPWRQLLREM